MHSPLTCPRCPTTRPTLGLLEAHLVEEHVMTQSRAAQEAKLSLTRTDAAEGPDHLCPKCKAPIACDWKAVGEMEKQARSLATIAGIWKARLNGVVIGRPRRLKETFDVEEARRLVAEGMTYAAVAKIVGAPSKQAIHRAFVRAAKNGNGAK